MKNETLLVTVFSDASLKDGKAGFGYWFKSSHASADGSAAGDREFQNSCQAEFIGITVAIAAAVKAHPGQRIDFVVCCDNINALALFMDIGARFAKTSKLKAYPSRKMVREFRRELDQVHALLQGGKVWLKHVKGHSSKKDCARSWVNNLTDKLAGKARRQ